MQRYISLDKKIKEIRYRLTRTEQYSVLSSSNSMAAHRLKPFPATPFSGRGMLAPVGWALAALRKASFSAEND